DEVEPAENQRKRDQDGDDAAPHDQEVREAPEAVPLEDEAVRQDLGAEASEPHAEVTEPEAAFEKGLPASPPVYARRRALQPHGVAIGEPERGKENGERVGDEG